MTSTQDKRTPIIILGILFFIFGFVTWLNGTLIPFLKLVCELETDVQAFLVTSCFYMAYFFLALPSSVILRKTGFKGGMSLGLLVMAAGCLIFIPAANARSFGMFLTGLFVQGMGLALLQTASNPYVSIVGPVESAARRLSIMGICNKVAGGISPLILGALVLKNATAIETQIKGATDKVVREQLLDQLAGRVIPPYIIMAVILLLLAFMVKRSSLPEIDLDREEPIADSLPNEVPSPDSVVSVPIRRPLSSFKHLWLGVICMFLYVGVEVMAGDAIGAYGREMDMPLDQTKYFTTFTLLSMLAGYIIGILTMPRYITQAKALAVSAALGVIFSLGAYLSSGYTAITFIALLGLANALMWPSIWPLAINGLGRYTKTGSALLIMGIAGGAVIPLLYTSLKDHNLLSNAGSFLVCTVPAYFYILYYAVKGHLVGTVSRLPRMNG